MFFKIVSHLKTANIIRRTQDLSSPKAGSSISKYLVLALSIITILASYPLFGDSQTLDLDQLIA
jgi:hypothetical protein